MISVIIPTCNRIDLLSKCLDLLIPQVQSVTAFDYEIIVTDDSNNDEAKSLIESKYPNIKWTKGPQKGPAANRNNGAGKAIGDWLLFIDDDCLPDRNILKEYLYNIKLQENILVFEGCIKADRQQKSLIEESPVNENGDFLWSCNFMINRKLFVDTLKGFDEQFPYPSMEDVDLYHRLKLLEIQTVFLKDALVIHPWRLQKEIYSITVKRFKSTLYFLRKHPEKKKDINSIYFIKAFYNGFFRKTLKKAVAFRFNGFFPKMTYDFMQLYFAIYMLRFQVKD